MQRKVLEDKIAEVEALKVKEVVIKKEEDKKAKEDKITLIKKRKEKVKEFSNLCELKLVGSNYDRFFVEEFVKKIPKLEAIEEIIEKLRALTGTSTNMIKEF